MDLISESSKNLLSKVATEDGHGENSPYFDGWKAYDSDPYHPMMNPKGVIQMGLAENQLSFDLIEEWVFNNPRTSICTREGAKDFKDIAIFQDYHGSSKIMSKVRGDRVTFDPDRIMMSGGATGAHEMLAFCLADPADAFLVPTPYYPGFDRDLRWRTGVQLVPIICESSNNFKITKSALNEALERARKGNIKVKGMLITNPSNPLGTIFDKSTLKTLVAFINENNIHLVIDEIYAATVFSKPNFISVTQIIDEDLSINRDLIHLVCSLSKDMGFPGFRVGIVYSYNDSVVNCARKMSSFGLVSTQTQHLLGSMLNDENFIKKFVIESGKRLGKRHASFTKGLGQVGIWNLESNAGLFLWMDLRKLLKEITIESEMELWRIIIHEVKLNVSPGSSFHCFEPGWFRVCFANMDDDTMKVALRRIRSFVLKSKEIESSTKRNYRQSNLQDNLSFRRLDDFIFSPHIMSPHSPIASPLVRART